MIDILIIFNSFYIQHKINSHITIPWQNNWLFKLKSSCNKSHKFWYSQLIKQILMFWAVFYPILMFYPILTYFLSWFTAGGFIYIFGKTPQTNCCFIPHSASFIPSCEIWVSALACLFDSMLKSKLLFFPISRLSHPDWPTGFAKQNKCVFLPVFLSASKIVSVHNHHLASHRPLKSS